MQNTNNRIRRHVLSLKYEPSGETHIQNCAGKKFFLRILYPVSSGVLIVVQIYDVTYNYNRS
jgi:hypothetical protein